MSISVSVRAASSHACCQHDSLPGFDLDNDDADADDDDRDTDTDDADNSIDLVSKPGTTRLELKPQHRRVRLVAKRAIDEFMVHICTINAYPDGAVKKSDFARQALINSAKHFNDKQILARLKDPEYWEALAGIVRLVDNMLPGYSREYQPTGRLSVFRKKVKDAADKLVGTEYGLRRGRSSEKVHWLQQELHYTCPFDYEVRDCQLR